LAVVDAPDDSSAVLAAIHVVDIHNSTTFLAAADSPDDSFAVLAAIHVVAIHELWMNQYNRGWTFGSSGVPFLV